MSEPSASAFHAAAMAYCAWCHQPRTEPEAEQAREALRSLTKLHSAALDLPRSPPCGGDPVAPEVTDDGWKAIYDSFQGLPFQYSGVVQAPHVDLPGEAVVGDLADDLADVYRDIKDGLALWEHGHPIEAVWHWRFHFAFHWGRHAADALRALHIWLEEEVEL